VTGHFEGYICQNAATRSATISILRPHSASSANFAFGTDGNQYNQEEFALVDFSIVPVDIDIVGTQFAEGTTDFSAGADGWVGSNAELMTCSSEGGAALGTVLASGR